MPAVPSCILDPLREQFLALLPPHVDDHPLGCHRRRIDDAVVFGKLVEALVYGAGYERLADTSCSATTMRRRRDEWIRLGVWDRTLRLRSRRAWRTRLDRVLDSLAPHLAPGGRVILAGVPDLGSFPALPQPLRTVLGWHARGLDRELRRLAAQRPGVLHVPVPPLTAPDLFATDAFHPNADAYAQWAQHLAETVN